MHILLNGQTTDIKTQNLHDALAELGFSGAAVATAVNGGFVPRGRRMQTRLSEGDRLEVLAPMQGG